jgi:RHS repeat-associated protein
VTYDGAGRMTAIPDGAGSGWRVMGYDAEARLTELCDWVCSGGSSRVFYRYDADGRPTHLTFAGGGTSTTTELRYSGSAIAEEWVDGVLTKRYLTDAEGVIVQLIVPAGQPGAGTYLVNWNGHGDALNPMRVNPDGTLAVANSFSYDSWGRPTTFTHGGSPDLGFAYLYVGKFGVRWEPTSELHLMGARHYSPALGRFIQPDPAALEDNPYAYAGNNPVSYIDPTGTRWQELVSRAWNWLGAQGWPAVQRFLGSAWQWTQRVGVNTANWTAARWNEWTRGLSIAWRAKSAGFNISANTWKKILAPHHQWAANNVPQWRMQVIASNAIQSYAMQIQRTGYYYLRMDWVWINWAFRSVCVHVWISATAVPRLEKMWIITKGCP